MSIKVIQKSDEDKIIATIDPQKIRDLYYCVRDTRVHVMALERRMIEIVDGLGIDV